MACLSCQVYWKTRRLIQELFFACAWKSWLQIPPTVIGHYFSISFISLCGAFISLTLYAVVQFKTVIMVRERKKDPSQTVKSTYAVFNVTGKSSIHYSPWRQLKITTYFDNALFKLNVLQSSVLCLPPWPHECTFWSAQWWDTRAWGRCDGH